MIKSWQVILAHYSFALQDTKIIYAYKRSFSQTEKAFEVPPDLKKHENIDV